MRRAFIAFSLIVLSATFANGCVTTKGDKAEQPPQPKAEKASPRNVLVYYMTEDALKDKEHPAEETAEGESDVSAKTNDPFLKKYFNHIVKKVGSTWIFPPDMENSMKSQKTVKAKLIIRKSGDLEKIIIVRSSGNTSLDEAVVTALRKATPFDPFPKSIRKKRLNVKADFLYQPRE